MALRMRIFAGPNGSGKSSLAPQITARGISLYTYINADEIERKFRAGEILPLPSGATSESLRILPCTVLSRKKRFKCFPHVYRAYFWDNSTDVMTYLGEYNQSDRFLFTISKHDLPKWCCRYLLPGK